MRKVMNNSNVSWRQLQVVVPILVMLLAIAGGYYNLAIQIALVQQRLDTIITTNTTSSARIDKIETQLGNHDLRLDRIERVK